MLKNHGKKQLIDLSTEYYHRKQVMNTGANIKGKECQCQNKNQATLKKSLCQNQSQHSIWAFYQVESHSNWAQENSWIVIIRKDQVFQIADTVKTRMRYKEKGKIRFNFSPNKPDIDWEAM